MIYTNENFPFEKDHYYLQKDIRTKLECGMMTGINYNKEGEFLVVFMNAHELKKHTNNPYLDRYDAQTKLYHYTGRGMKGDQTLTGANERLANSNVNKTDIHFFRQLNVGNKHQYVGRVKLEKIIDNIQPDEFGRNRKVYEFLLKSINE